MWYEWLGVIDNFTYCTLRQKYISPPLPLPFCHIVVASYLHMFAPIMDNPSKHSSWFIRSYLLIEDAWFTRRTTTQQRGMIYVRRSKESESNNSEPEIETINYRSHSFAAFLYVSLNVVINTISHFLQKSSELVRDSRGWSIKLFRYLHLAFFNIRYLSPSYWYSLYRFVSIGGTRQEIARFKRGETRNCSSALV